MKTHSDSSGRTGPHLDGWAVPDPAMLYPAECHFRIIVTGDFCAEAELHQVLGVCELTSPLTPGKSSREGKYRSLELSVRVKDRAELVRLHEGLKGVKGVRMVL